MEQINRLIKKIAPLNRYNVSPGLDQALLELQNQYSDLIIHKYATGTRIWDWIAPQKWDLTKAEVLCDGKKIFSHLDSPVRVWSGSWPTTKKLTYNEFIKHVQYDKDTPDLIPWDYKYYWHNENFYGFGVTKAEYEALNPQGSYTVKIDSKFYDDYLTMGTLSLRGETDKIIIISSDICHPGQVNDSLTGVACALYIYEKLKNLKNRHYSYLFTFQPEMIGTMGFLSHNENLIPKINYGIFTEMLGHQGKITLQHSLSKNTHIDATAINILLDQCPNNLEVKDFLQEGIMNDELILNHTGIHIPSIALNRGTFREYHTSGDCYEFVNFDLVYEVAEVTWKIIQQMEKEKFTVSDFERKPERIRAANRYSINANRHDNDYIPTPTYKGPIFLSKHGLYVDWRHNPKLNTILDRLLVQLNGTNSCSDIARYCGAEFSLIYDFLEKLYAKNLITKKPL